MSPSAELPPETGSAAPPPPAAAAVPPNVTVRLLDRSEPMSRAAAVQLRVGLDVPPQAPGAVVLRVSWPGGAAEGAVPVGPDVPLEQAWSTSIAGPPGRWPVTAVAHWGDAAGPVVAEAALDVLLWASAGVVLNASEPYASGQNVFQAMHVVAFAPWANESAYALLGRAAERYGFGFDAPYDAALGSYYVRMINGTEETWVVQGVVSHSWMILHNGTLADRAVDDLLPADGDTVEFRFVRCWSTGSCQGV